MLSTKSMSGLVSVLVFGGGMLNTGQAVASCVYNHTGNTEVSVDVGAINLHVLAGEHGCTDGTGGNARVRKVINNAFDPLICEFM